MKLFAGIVVAVVILAAILGPQALFVVDETQLAVVTRFGEPRKQIKSPGLYVKTPFIDTVTYFDNRLLIFDAPADSLLTKDKKRLIIDVYARARITDPLTFYRTVRTGDGASARAIDIISSELRREIALDEQSEIIRTNRESILNRVRDAVAPQLATFGIEVVDVRIKAADFPKEIAASIYERMKAERQRIADRERAEGAEADLEKRAEVDRAALEIRSAAQRDADIIRGEGDAEAIKIFAEALGQDPEFYQFQRTLEAYKTILNENTTLVIPADSDLLKYLQSPGDALTSDSPDGVVSPASHLAAEKMARTYLAGALALDPSKIVLDSVEVVSWSDTSLGCPLDGQQYAQVIIPGYRFLFSEGINKHEVHSDLVGSAVTFCKAQ